MSRAAKNKLDIGGKPQENYDVAEICNLLALRIIPCTTYVLL